MNSEEQVVERAVYSWSRFASAGQTALAEALKVFNPISKDLSDTERQMVSYLQELKDQGHKPVVLKSKDVYGYKSCTTEPLTSEITNKAQKVQKQTKKRGRKPLIKKKDVNYTLLSTAAKVILKNQPKILLTNLSVETLQQTGIPRPPVLTERSVQAQQCLKLTNIKGLSGGHTARLQIHFGLDSQGMAKPNPQCPPALSGIPFQPLENGSHTPKVVALDHTRMVALIGDSAPVIYQNGIGLKERNNYQTVPMRLDKPGVMSNSLHWRNRDSVRMLQCQGLDGSQSVLVMNGQEESRLNGNSLQWKVIKVDDSFTDEEVRRKAQKILRVNLSPVIQIQPLVAHPV